METQEITVREHILQTATRLFHDQGYNLTGINQIIDEAGVAKASLYYHFPSKEDLCVAYLHRRNNTWFSALETYLKDVDDPKQRIIKTFDYRAIHLKKNHFGGCSHIKIISEMPQRGEKIDQAVILQKEKQRKFFLDLTEQAEGNRKKAASLAETIFLLFDGGTVQCQVYRDPAPLQAAKKAVVSLLNEDGKK
ncbi:TetR/AcrR family transcriptional regulator [soil metagenome]